MVRNNSFEGGSDGTVITTGNSGGPSGDAFDSLTGSSILTFEDTHPHEGTLGMAQAFAGTSVASHADWLTLGSITTSVWIRTYMWFDALPNANFRLGIFRTSTPGNSAILQITTAGILRFLRADATTVTASTGSTAIATGQQIRIEARCLSSTTAGEIEWWLYNSPESETPTETISVGSEVLGANTDGFFWGTNATTGPTNQTIYSDDLAISDVGKIGPSGGGGPTETILVPQYPIVGARW